MFRFVEHSATVICLRTEPVSVMKRGDMVIVWLCTTPTPSIRGILEGQYTRPVQPATASESGPMSAAGAAHGPAVAAVGSSRAYARCWGSLGSVLRARPG